MANVNKCNFVLNSFDLLLTTGYTGDIPTKAAYI